MGKIFKLDDSMPCFSVIDKCAAAVDAGDVSHLTKAHFESALDGIAREYARATGISFQKAYQQVLRTKLGGTLFAGYNAARATPPTPVKKVDASSPPAWAETLRRASLLRQRNPQLTEAQAIAKVCTDDETLYRQYVAETSGP